MMRREESEESGLYKMVFNGADQYLNLAYSTALNLGTSSFTLGMWLKMLTITGNRIIFRTTSTANTFCGILLVAESNQIRLYMSFDNSSWAIFQFVKTFTVNELLHLMIVRSGNNFTVYINNTSVYTFTNSGSLVNNSGSNYSYGQYGGYSYPNIELYDAFLFNRALNSTERTSIYTDKPFADANLLIHIPPLNDSGTTINNEGSAADAILVGTVSGFIIPR